MRRFWFVTLLVLIACSAAGAAQTYSYVDLVNRLTDLEALAVLPQSGETCAQWSSYDRASYYDEKAGKYVGWDANGDGGGVIRAEGDGFLVAEMKGPGCIWRIWSALAGGGHVKIYLDGATEPTVDLPFIGYFDLKNPPFVYPSLVHEVARGFNNYVPIPYQKSCRIVMDKDWGAYYHFTYSTFPWGTKVPTFKRDLSAEEEGALSKADRFLRMSLGSDPAGKRAGEETVLGRVRLAAGEEATVASLTGQRAITSLWVQVDPSTLQKSPELLRDVILRIRWEDEERPSVWAPLGDFFGTGPGANIYTSLPLGMTEYGFYSYWYMPFAREAVVELVNEGSSVFSGTVTLTHAPLTRPIRELGRFHAKWHRDALLPKEPERAIDWTMLRTRGPGRYCGVMLEVWNPRGGWWGEGDEKFFVDGQKFPSTIGTGSEDYFGYAWCTPQVFHNAYHNQTRVNNNVGHVSVNRWHITDNVPFQKSFEGAIEKYYPNDRPTLYASTVYWYIARGGFDPYEPVPVKDRTFYIEPEVVKKPGVLEGEGLKILGKTGGDAQAQELRDKWSGDSHLWWINAKPGDTLDLALPVQKKGSYEVRVALTKARDYGIVQLYLDGQKIGDPFDLYDPNVVPTGEISLGTMELSAGEHKLTVEIVGANEKAIKSYMFGLDYVRLQGAK